MVVRYFPHSKFHGKTRMTGSDYIRCEQLIKHWPDAGLYRYGDNPDVLIFNKIFCSEDYKFPAHFENIKILDLCDPMWLEGSAIVETCHAMDAVVVPTQPLADYVLQFYKNVYVVPDRFDLDILPAPKKHRGKAKTVVWFGYAHNSIALKPALALIEELKLKLIIISDQDPLDRWRERENEAYRFIRYDEDTIHSDIQEADFAILPDGLTPRDIFKSNNRTIKAQLLGLPVAKTPEEVNHYMEAKNRKDWFDTEYANIRLENDVIKSVEQMKGIIDEIKTNRR